MRNKTVILAGAMILTAISLTACGANGSITKSQVRETQNNNLHMIIGGGGEHNIILDAGAIEVEELDSKYMDAIEDLIKGKKGYEKENQQLLQNIKEQTKEETVYVSLEPIFQWDVEKNKIIYDSPSVVVFSKDYNFAWKFEFTWQQGKYVNGNYGELESKIFDTLNQNPKEEYLYWGAYEQEELLSSKNERVIISGMNSNTVSVKGDYYEKVSEIGITISMSKLQSRVEEIRL